MNPLLTICDVKARSVEHVEQRIVSGCVFMSLDASRGWMGTRLVSFRKENRDGKYEGVDRLGGLDSELAKIESVGELPKDGTEASLGGLP